MKGRVQGSILEVMDPLEGEGHLSLAVSAFERILDELVDADPSGIMPPGP